MDKKKVNIQFGGSFTTLLTILFIGLKLTGHITWSWLWVLSPSWIPIALIFSILIIMFLGALIFGR
jgi:uncharacterized protein (DUF983 family)